jgi:hypothetical protein
MTLRRSLKASDFPLTASPIAKSDSSGGSKILTPSEIAGLRRTILSALPSDDRAEDKVLFVLPTEDLPPPEVKTP